MDLHEMEKVLNEVCSHDLSLVKPVASSPVSSSSLPNSTITASPDSSTSGGLESTESTDTPASQLEDLARPLQFHYPEMPIALKALLGGKIQAVEYGSQVQYRCGYAEVLVWAVPDDQLSLPSQILIDKEFPLKDLESSHWRHVHLLPLSFVGLTLEETIEVPSTFADDLSLLSPKPPRYLLSLIRNLLKLPLGDPSRFRVEKEILTFISAYVLHGPPSHTPRWVVAQQSEESYQEQDRYLEIIELAVRNCQYIRILTDVADSEPSSPIREYGSDASGW
ncbi:hypothetical protein N7493_011299 [Penicillium malachiteum]|uniref:Uncharacterized protein n=1 Tax=Penicillium malachiteum TaxID=1324776 RepID=A0AAD6HBU8_9EURO|nr:hypothetical protein N7493_011299 [Penicillium malachiteum]